jgi:hypothetical protein
MSRPSGTLVSPSTVLVAIDDTDTVDSEYGTGKVSRLLGAHVAEELPRVTCLGSVRQQLLIDPRVPYTTHNSAACLLCMTTDDFRLAGVVDEASGFLEDIAAPGSDPGLCVGRAEAVSSDVTEYGLKAGNVVVSEDRAYDLADDSDLFLAEYGGTGEGVIGALAAVGRTATGDRGRFIDYGCIREVDDVIPVGRLRDDGIRVRSESGDPIARGSVVTEGWLRPLLRDGRPTVEVARRDEGRYRPTNLDSR